MEDAKRLESVKDSPYCVRAVVLGADLNRLERMQRKENWACPLFIVAPTT